MKNNEQTVRWVAVVVMVIITAFSGYTSWSQAAYQADMEDIRSRAAIESVLITDLRVQTAILATTMEHLLVEIKEMKEIMKDYLLDL